MTSHDGVRPGAPTRDRGIGVHYAIGGSGARATATMACDIGNLKVGM